MFSSHHVWAEVLPEERADIGYHYYDGGGVEVDGATMLVRTLPTAVRRLCLVRWLALLLSVVRLPARRRFSGRRPPLTMAVRLRLPVGLSGV